MRHRNPEGVPDSELERYHLARNQHHRIISRGCLQFWFVVGCLILSLLLQALGWKYTPPPEAYGRKGVKQERPAPQD